MACFVRDRYRGLGGDAMASLCAIAVLEREEQTEKANLELNRELGTKQPKMSIVDVRI